MKQDQRAPYEKALRRARLAAYGPGEYVEQESFMGAHEILELARRADIDSGVRLLDLCCGVAGPGRFITRTTGCDYQGVDLSESALAIARDRADDLPCSFEVLKVPPLPNGRFDVVLLLETMLAFPDKEPLLLEVARTLELGGRFAFTLEEGLPLADSEREQMPEADTVWLTPLDEMLALLEGTGFTVTWQLEVSEGHRANAVSLIKAFTDDRESIAAAIGPQAIDQLIAGHELWRDWLNDGRVRKFAVVAERTAVCGSPICDPQTVSS
jgi:SAM-dependent methyltransferase